MRQTVGVRYLTIVRHAKAVKKTPPEVDYERALNDRGRAQCAQLREWATDPDALGAFGPTVALVSSARRTRETYELGLEGTGFVSDVYYSDLIYNGVRDVGAEDLLIDLAAIDPVTSSLCVVAHNPTVLELLVTLSGRVEDVRRDGYPLAGAFVLEIDDDRPVGLARYELVARFIPD